MPYIVIGNRYVPQRVVALVPEKLVRKRTVLPVGYGENSRTKMILVATNCPQDLVILDEVAFATRMKAKPVLVGREDLDRAVERHFGPAPPLLYRSELRGPAQAFHRHHG